MSTDQTQRTIDRYFELMGRGADFADCYTADVSWLVADTGAVITGPDAVRNYIVALHKPLVDAHTTRFVVGDDYVYLEGACSVAADPTGRRLYYCVAYQMKGELIAAMRCYGLGAESPA